MTLAQVTPAVKNPKQQDYSTRLLNPKALMPYMPKAADLNNLSNQVKALIAQQRQHCQKIGTSYEQLENLQTRPMQIATSNLVVQFNPARVRNNASFDKRAISSRPCFLDPDNLFPDEQGIDHGDFVIFGNAYPVLKDHLTIVRKTHTNQLICDLISPACELAKQLADSHFVFYNGPETGASAPDHSHLQAGSRDLLPIEADLAVIGKGEPIVNDNEVQIYIPDNLGRTVIVINSSRADLIESSILGIMSQSPSSQIWDEPLINLIFTYNSGIWTAYYFPRTRYRPHHFFADTEDRLLISPAALELAGIMVVTNPADYAKLTPELALEIYSDVCINRDDTLKLVKSLHQLENH